MKECYLCGKRREVQEHHVVQDWGDHKHGKIRHPGDDKWTVQLCHACHEKIHKEFWTKLPEWREQANQKWKDFIREKTVRQVYDR